MSFWTPVENPRTRPLRSWVFDVGCALLAAASSFGSFSFAQAAHPSLPTMAVSLVVAVLTALVLSLRRVWPGPVFAVTVLMAAVLAEWPVRGALFPFPSAIALYTVAVTMSRTTALVAAALAVAAEIPATGQGGWHNGWLAAIYEVIAIASVLVAGLYVSTRRAYLAELRDRTQRLEREHDQTSALAAAVERARIAREMHDSVAHHLTVIVALSDGALAAVTRSPAQASDAIRGVSSTAREALAETRRLLGVLRADAGQTTFDLDDYVYAGLRAGASGFLLKDTQPADLVAAIHTIAAGDAVLGPAATSRLVRQFAATQPPEPPSSQHAAQIRQVLTSREQDVFARIAAGMSNGEIATSLFLSEGTVKIHVGRILAKLCLRDRVQAVVLAYESRLITPGTPPPDRPGRPY
jgi:DNA-binding CsgD family transcriptional regulator